MRKEFQLGLIVIVIVLFISNVLTLQRVKELEDSNGLTLQRVQELEELTITRTDNLEQNMNYFAQKNYISGPEVMRMINDHIWWDHQNE